MKYKYILCDMNNLFFRSWAFNIESMIYQNEKVYTGGIQQAIHRLNQLIDTFSYRDQVQVYLLFDNPTSTIKIRQEIDENYKSHRLNKKTDLEFYKTLNILKRILRCYSDKFYICNIKSCEADDLTKPIIQYLNTKEKILCVSVDLDWARNISENVHWYNYSKVYDMIEFEKDYNFKATENNIKMYKAIKGDPSDCITVGISHLPDNVLWDIIKNYNNILDLLKNLKNLKYDDSIKKKIKDNSKKLLSNYQLVDFIDLDCNIQNFIQKCEIRLGELKIWYNVLDIPFEGWMITEKQEKKDQIFKQVKYTRKLK